MYRSRRSLPLLLLLFASFAACGGDAAGPRPLAGTYTLRAVNQAPLPFRTERTDDRRIDIVGGRLVLNANGSCEDVLQFQDVTGGTAGPVHDDRVLCTYVADGASLQVTHAGGTVIPMNVSGNTITAFTARYTLEYRR